MTPRYSIIMPTFRRGPDLAACLQSVCALDYPLSSLEVLVIDNGGAEHTRAYAEPFMDRLRIRYLVNRRNGGFGFSVNRGIVESRGERLMLLTDDVRLMPDFLRRCDELLESDPSIGCVGCRAIEENYQTFGSDVGRIMDGGYVLGNFVLDTGRPVEVEHVYGFTYVFTREAVGRAGLNDRTLLAQPYSSGNRIETDHCLTIRRKGLKVMYHPGMVARHLARPRPDMSEVDERWHKNEIRNTLYVMLKHFGLFGKGGAALRLTFLQHVGILSLLRHPSASNLSYFGMAIVARISAFAHWGRYMAGSGYDSPDRFREELAAAGYANTPVDSFPTAARGIGG
jgi:GT2 family glycosyltransferase